LVDAIKAQVTTESYGATGNNGMPNTCPWGGPMVTWAVRLEEDEFKTLVWQTREFARRFSTHPGLGGTLAGYPWPYFDAKTEREQALRQALHAIESRL
jgi:hypothetical protein